MAEGRDRAPEAPPLEQIRRFDDVRLETPAIDWPVEVPPFEEGRFHSAKHRALQVQWRVQVEQLGLNLLPPTAFSGVLPLEQHRFAVHFRGEQLGVEQERVVDPAALAKARDSQEGHLCHNRMRVSTARPR